MFGFTRHKTRFPKFCTVGLTGVFVNEGLLFFFTEIGGLFYIFSAIIAIEASILSNFLLNEFWTFSDLSNEHRGVSKRIVKYNIVSVAGLLINLSILFALTTGFGLHYLISNLFGIAGTTLWNYLVNLNWTWAKRI